MEKNSIIYMYMGDMKIFANVKKVQLTIIQTMKNIQPVYRNGTGIEKCTKLIREREKRDIMEDKELTNQERIRGMEHYKF